MKLSLQQEEIVFNKVVSAGFQMETLRDNIVDHLCCVVESQLGKSKSFETLLDEAINDLAPNGLKQIENQTLFLLNSKRIIIMKKIMYTTGFTGALCISAGTLFKIMHWPLANILLAIGFTLLLFIFFPLLGIDLYKVSIAKSVSQKLKIILGVSSAVLVGLSGVFKILHLQGASLLLILGFLIFALGFLPFLFFNMYKKSVS